MLDHLRLKQIEQHRDTDGVAGQACVSLTQYLTNTQQAILWRDILRHDGHTNVQEMAVDLLVARKATYKQ